MSMPLQKWLQACGVGSRRQVQVLIAGGAVRVDGEAITRFAELVSPEQSIEVDGEPLGAPSAPVVYLMHKPKKHITKLEPDASDSAPALGHYLPEDAPFVFPVGRLDYNTEGALLFTNDGGLARRVLHPDWSLEKRYGVKVRGHLSADAPGFERMRAGMEVEGVTYRPARVELGPSRSRATWIFITITEGKNRQIRKMCAACGYQIVKLRREAIGPLELGALNPRCVRPLTPAEVVALYGAVGLEPPSTS